MNPFDAADLSAEFTTLYSGRRAFSKGRQRAIVDFQRSQARRCSELASQILEQSYKPHYRGVLIPQFNSNGSFKKNRGITPLASADWIVQRILLREIVAATGVTFATNVSYGRRAVRDEIARSPANCCLEIGRMRASFPWAVRADLVAFFPSISREELSDALHKVLPDEWPWHWLLNITINTDSLPAPKATKDEIETFWPKGTGVHQGTVLAPFFANVFMAEWDQKWGRIGRLFRYVDDWLLLGSNLEALQRTAEEMSLDLPQGAKCHLDDPEKAKTYSPSENIEFLGLAISSDGRVLPSDKSIERHEASVREKAEKASNVIDLALKLYRYNEAWKVYYSAVAVSQRVKDCADARVGKEVNDWLERKHIGSSVRGEIRKLLKAYRPIDDGQINDAISFALESGEAHPENVDSLISAMT